MVPVVVAMGLLAATPQAWSQGTSPVIQLLLNARDARTRVQAALTLGRLRPAGSRAALETALDDANAAVRAAAAESLGVLGDSAAVPALRSHANDRDPGVRSGVTHALATLGPSGNNNNNAGGGGDSGASPGGDFSHAHFVIRVGTLANRAGGRPALVDVMRDAIMRECGRSAGMACAVGANLPPEAEQRVRTAHVRAYAIEGSVNTLRRSQVASTLSVRAEVSLVLMTHPTRAIIGELSGAATAQDPNATDNPDGRAQHLEERALAAAVHGALGNLQQALPDH
jgi:hypothetical protein